MGFLLKHRKITSASEVATRTMEGSRHDKSASPEHQTTKGSYTLVAAWTRNPAHSKHQAGGRGRLPASGSSVSLVEHLSSQTTRTKQGPHVVPLGSLCTVQLSPVALHPHSGSTVSPPAWEALEFHCLLLTGSSLFNLSHGHGSDRISYNLE